MPITDRQCIQRHIELDSSTNCWNWTGYIKPTGYGQICRPLGEKRKAFPAHRLSYRAYKTEIPSGKEIDHICRNRRCVNPQHLRVVTRLENIMAPGSLAVAKKYAEATYCVNKHEFTIENTLVSCGYRICRTCHRSNSAAYKRRKRLEAQV